VAGLAAALPLIPSVSCPSAAAALGAAGLAPLCQATSGVSGAVGSAASQVAGFGVSSVLDAVASWVSAGAVWLLGQIGSVLATTTSIDLGASWFTDHYRTMAGLAGVVVVPLLLVGVIQAIHRQSASMLVRSVAVNVPLAILLTAVAVQLVQLGLSVTDSMSAAVAQGAGINSGHFFDRVIEALQGPATLSGPATPTFVVLLGALAVVVGAFLLWVELLVRAAAVYVAVLFLPLALASLAWPAIAHWCRRLVDTLAALVLGKFVIVSVLSLAVGALAGGQGFADVLGGAALLALAAAAPWALFRLLPMLESGAVGHLEGQGRRTYQSVAGPAWSLANTAMRLSGGPAKASGVGTALGSAASGGAGSGGAGSGGESSGSEFGPSSVEQTGVGTVRPAGSGIPKRAPTPGAREAYEASLRGDGLAPDGTPLDPATGGRGSGSGPVRVVAAGELNGGEASPSGSSRGSG
jgi:hypothetical protein